MKALLAAAALATGLVVASASGYAQSLAHTRFTPDEVSYKPGPGGIQTAALFGDPAKPGLYVLQVKLPPGAKLAPHWHPDEVNTVTVLSGTLYWALGEQWDESKLAAYPAGSFFNEPPKTPHFAWAKDGEVVVRVTAIGPRGTVPVAQAQ